MNADQARSRENAPPNAVWGFSLALLLAGVLASLAQYAIAAWNGQFALNPLWPSGLAGNCIGMFVAGFAAYSFVIPQPGGRIVRTVLLAGLTFALAFPLKAFVSAVVGTVMLGYSDSSLADLLSWVLYLWWWTPVGIVDWALLIAVVLASTVGTGLSQGFESGKRHPDRWLNPVVGGLLLAWGLTLAGSVWLSITYEIEKLAMVADQYPDARSRMYEGAAYLRNERWGMVIWRSLPFVIVGGLLLGLSFKPSRPQ